MQATWKQWLFNVVVYLLILFFLVQTNICLADNVADGDINIHVVKSKSREYYHIEFMLSRENFIMDQRQLDGVIKEDGGQFEIYIKKEFFPIKAPNCKSQLILRMPWTKSTLINADQFINEKISLYRELRNVVDGVKPVERVVIELNPYIKLNNADPLDIELTQCNIFFRHSHGRYIDYLGKVKN